MSVCVALSTVEKSLILIGALRPHLTLQLEQLRFPQLGHGVEVGLSLNVDGLLEVALALR